ncbi:MAG: hypothetical protein LLG05_18915 [Porphyromonadaceae bacterium]|nr:hypothetical protein [Porphyromonadaceae bacterium]
MKILAIDPGNMESAYVLMDENYNPILFGKGPNEELIGHINCLRSTYFEIGEKGGQVILVIEMVASYGMAVGKEVFETCVWIGRFSEQAYKTECPYLNYMYRKDVKMNLCGQTKAKDSNIIQALKDRFGDKGTVKAKGWFYGFKKDIWQAYAVGVTYLDEVKQNEHT